MLARAIKNCIIGINLYNTFEFNNKSVLAWILARISWAKSGNSIIVLLSTDNPYHAYDDDLLHVPDVHVCVHDHEEDCLEVFRILWD